MLDFAVICEVPDERKYNYILFPEADYFGVIFPDDSDLAKKKQITVNDLIGHPLFCSQQSWENDIRPWAKEHFSQLHLEGSFQECLRFRQLCQISDDPVFFSCRKDTRILRQI